MRLPRDIVYAMVGGLGLMAFVALCFVVPPVGYAVFALAMFGVFWFLASTIVYGVMEIVREELRPPRPRPDRDLYLPSDPPRDPR